MLVLSNQNTWIGFCEDFRAHSQTYKFEQLRSWFEQSNNTVERKVGKSIVVSQT
jgi:hypothetical protein